MLQPLLVGCLALGATGFAIWSGGGFDAGPQWVFAGLACAAGAVALARREALRFAKAPPVLVLLALACLGALSASWTLGAPAEVLRWGAVTLGYAALAVAVGATVRAEWLAAAVAAAAATTGLAGLVSAAAHSTVFAERIDGGWRPEGPFGYPPALAILQVCAMPVLLAAMARARPTLSATAGCGTAVAAGVLALDVSRLAVIAAVALAAIALAVPAQTVRGPRAVVAAALALAAGGGFAIHAVAGGWRSGYAHGSTGAVVLVLAVVATIGPVWLLVRRFASRVQVRARHGLPLRVLAVAAVVASLGVGLGLADTLGTRRWPAHQGFSHGRTWIWRTAAEAALDRPIAGSGAGTFLRATILDQPGRGRLTRFAHNLPLELAAELGVLGLALGLALYLAVGRALWRARGSPALWLTGPAVVAFLASNLLDWTWHLAGIGAVFAAALGASVALRTEEATEARACVPGARPSGASSPPPRARATSSAA